MKKIDFTIRKGTKKDLDILVYFRYKLDKFEHQAESTIPLTSKKQVRATTKKNLASRNYFFFIAEVDGKPVGFSAASTKIHPRTQKRRGTFEAIWVEPKYRQQGIASALSKVRLKKLRQYKPERIAVYIRPDNKKSAGNIKKLGGRIFLNMYTFDK